MTAHSHAREHVARLFESLADGKVSSADAQTQIRAITPWDDEDLDDAFHFLQHFSADEDIRSLDEDYAASQIETLKLIVARLRGR